MVSICFSFFFFNDTATTEIYTLSLHDALPISIGLSDITMMFEYSIYSVISPEGCASILYKDASKASIAAESLKLTSKHLKKNKLVEKIIPEPLGGIHRNPEQACELLKKAIKKQLKAVSKIPTDQLLRERHTKLLGFGRFNE